MATLLAALRGPLDPVLARRTLTLNPLALVGPKQGRTVFGRTAALGPKDRKNHGRIERVVEVEEPERRYVERKHQKDESISPKQERDQGRQEKEAAKHYIEDQPREALVAHVSGPKNVIRLR